MSIVCVHVVKHTGNEKFVSFCSCEIISLLQFLLGRLELIIAGRLRLYLSSFTSSYISKLLLCAEFVRDVFGGWTIVSSYFFVIRGCFNSSPSNYRLPVDK